MLPPNINIIYFPPRQWLYWIILTMVIASFSVLPFIKTTISIRTNGVIRPASERTEVKSMLSRHIDQLYVKEGDTVKQGQLIAMIKDRVSEPKALLNQIELNQKNKYIQDLRLLTEQKNAIEQLPIASLTTPLYKEQLSKFQFQMSDHQSAIKKVSNELSIYTSLLAEKVIARKEHFDKQIELDRLVASFNAFKNNQLISWQNDLQQFLLDKSLYQSQRSQIEVDQSNHFIHAPVAGVIQNINTRYKGGVVTAGESLCLVSPLTKLVAECYLSTKDIGMLTIGHAARFQMDAFDYQYFGLLSGKVFSIDNDYALINNQPVFKVYCNIDNAQLNMKNGYIGKIKKGLSFQARFIVTERTLWNLLFDTMDDWFNPVAHVKS